MLTSSVEVHAYVFSKMKLVFKWYSEKGSQNIEWAERFDLWPFDSKSFFVLHLYTKFNFYQGKSSQIIKQRIFWYELSSLILTFDFVNILKRSGACEPSLYLYMPRRGGGEIQPQNCKKKAIFVKYFLTSVGGGGWGEGVTPTRSATG